MSLKVGQHTNRKMKQKTCPFDLRQGCLWILIGFSLSLASPTLFASELENPKNEMILISGGNYSPLYKENGIEPSISVDTFYLVPDRKPGMFNQITYFQYLD
jgi:hypothetical protein